MKYLEKQFEKETEKKSRDYYLEGDLEVWEHYNNDYTEWLEQQIKKLEIELADNEMTLKIVDSELKKDGEQANQIKGLDNSLLAETKRADFLKQTCENFEKQIKELENDLKTIIEYDKNGQRGSNGWEYLLGTIDIKLNKH